MSRVLETDIWATFKWIYMLLQKCSCLQLLCTPPASRLCQRDRREKTCWIFDGIKTETLFSSSITKAQRNLICSLHIGCVPLQTRNNSRLHYLYTEVCNDTFTFTRSLQKYSISGVSKLFLLHVTRKRILSELTWITNSCDLHIV